jgi:hypothetical protein
MPKFEKQLLTNLNEYENAGIFDSAVRIRFEKYLNGKIEQGENSAKIPLLYVLYTLGISIAALGVILIIAYNWTDFPKAARLLFGFMPLLLSGGFAFWYLITKASRSAYWREIIPVLNTTGIITSIAVVSQVYHIEGDFTGFMRTVIILSALLPFIFNSGISALVNTVCILTAFIGNGESADHFASLAYLTVIGVFLTHGLFRGEQNPIKAFALAVFAVLTPAYCFFFMIDGWRKEYYDLHFLVYPVFSGLLLAAFSLHSSSNKKYLIPAAIVAGMTAFVTTFVFAFERSFYRISSDFWESSFAEFSLTQWGVLGIIALCALFYFYFSLRSLFCNNSDKGLLALSFIGFIGILLFVSGNFLQVSSQIFYFYYLGINLYAILMCLVFIVSGIRSHSLARLNIGALMLSVFIFTKFVSDEFTMLTRGVAFIILGVMIILLNGIIIKLRKEKVSQ